MSLLAATACFASATTAAEPPGDGGDTGIVVVPPDMGPDEAPDTGSHMLPDNGGIRAGRNAGSGRAHGATDAAATDSGSLTIIKTPAQNDTTTTQAGSTQEQGALVPGPAADPALAPQTQMPLYLEVAINGRPTNLIAEFVQLPGGGFAARARELDELGISVPTDKGPEELVRLEDLGAETAYDEAEQKIDIRLPPERLKRNVIDLAAAAPVRLTPGGSGMVLNYSLLASARAEDALTERTFDGVSAQLEGWIYSPLGTLFSSGFVKREQQKRPVAVRLDTRWQFVDLERAVHYQAGDVITAGPDWARPVRLGGVQVRRSFRLRPDIVSVPLPSLSGTAAVPTVIDVYVNNLKVHSGEVSPGPFEIANIPALSQGGVARLVMRDAAGREIVREQSFYVSPRLLRADLFEFSLAAGVPRFNFGERSFDYDWRYPGLSASVRYGVNDRVTVEGHAEVARDLVLGGGGVNLVAFDRVLVGLSGAVSHSERGMGLLAHVRVETHLGGFHLAASSLRTFGAYADLAALSSARTLTASAAVTTALDVPRAVESVNLGYAFATLGASLNVGLVHTQRRDGERNSSLNVGYTQNLWGRASLYATALFDLGDLSRPGLFAGITVPLGGGANASSGISSDAAGGWRASATYHKSLKMKDNSVGWRARVTYGDLNSLEGSLAWRTPFATIRGTAMQVNRATVGQLSVDGALVMADGALFASNRITDAFAVVNAGAPGVRVRHENREVGVTRSDGRLLVTSLRSLQRNKISIDPETLPVDAIVEDDKTYVVPAVRGGVVVRFNTQRVRDAALVVLHDEAGRPIAPGAEVRVAGVEETFVVGYDGETWVSGLKASNTLTVTTDGGSCQVRFAFRPKGDEVQPRIGPLTCRAR